MRTTYKGINRGQALKQYRELLEHQKSKVEGRAENLKQKYFPEPTKLDKVWGAVKALFSILVMGLVASTVLLLTLAYFMAAI